MCLLANDTSAGAGDGLKVVKVWGQWVWNCMCQGQKADKVCLVTCPTLVEFTTWKIIKVIEKNA